MNNNVLLIDEDYIKTETIVNDNLNGQAITPSIIIAQEIGLQSVIGTRLLRKIQDLIANNTISQTANASYKALLDDYITPYLLNKCCVEILTNVTYKVRQIGVISATDEKVVNVQSNTLKELCDAYRAKASHYSITLVNYLKHFSANFPEFNVADCYELLGDYDLENCPINLDRSNDFTAERTLRGNYYYK